MKDSMLLLKTLDHFFLVHSVLSHTICAINHLYSFISLISHVLSKIILMFLQLALVSPSNEEFEMLLEEIRTRIMETQGETIYELGVGGL